MRRNFHISDVLSCTTEILVSTRHIEGVYDILNFVTGQNLFTHQLPRANEWVKPLLAKQFPDLAKELVPEDLTDDVVRTEWIRGLSDIYGEYLDVESVEGFEAKNPIQELIDMKSGLQ
jgi:hypothetical protein